MILGDLLVIVLFFISVIGTILAWRVILSDRVLHIKHEALVIFGAIVGIVVFVLSLAYLINLLNVPEFLTNLWNIKF